MMNRSITIIWLVLMGLSLHVTAGTLRVKRTLQWSPEKTIPVGDTSISVLYFQNAVVEEDALPRFFEIFPLSDNEAPLQVLVDSAVYVPYEGTLTVSGVHHEAKVSYNIRQARDKRQLAVELLPLRMNLITGRPELLSSFTLVIETGTAQAMAPKKSMHRSNSVMRDGNWYKIGVTKTGMHKISYEQLAQMGVDVSDLDPHTIRVFGYGGGALPELNIDDRYQDLPENAIRVMGEEDGSFDPQDYIVFYAKNSVYWDYNNLLKRWEPVVHSYCDTAYYFVATGLGPGLRVQDEPSVTQAFNREVTTFVDRAFHKKELYNVLGMGRLWLGESFDTELEYNFNFNFPNIVKTHELFCEFSVVARCPRVSSFQVDIAQRQHTVNVAGITLSGLAPEYARKESQKDSFKPLDDDVAVKIKYLKQSGVVSLGWLDYIFLNVQRQLIFTGGQMAFRDPYSAYKNNISRFDLGNGAGDIRVWDVTDPVAPRRVQTTLAGDQRQFTLHTDEVREFVAWDGTDFITPAFVGSVPNQNLHGVSNVEYVIVSPPELLSEANRLATFHANESDLIPLVVTPQQIYNEFSSGTRDAMAIRDFMRYLYFNQFGTDRPLRYLLLLGDGSYDNKNILPDNTALIPTWQTPSSFSPTTSIVVDDVYGYLDEYEGASLSPANNTLDIGIGRFPVATKDEAAAMVDKVVHYASSEESRGDWRNVICVVADDMDKPADGFLDNGETISDLFSESYPQYNLDKIYLDAYPQVSASGGERYPMVNEAINARMANGALVVNYIGHGGETGWSQERVLQNSDVFTWTNFDKMPVFITATCEFSRFDDPKRTSTGEYVFLNKKGGAVAMFTTTRLTFGNSNMDLTQKIYRSMFDKPDNKIHTLGDIMLEAKAVLKSTANSQKFILLGDPALSLNLPTEKVVTTAINNMAVGEDTLRALSKVMIEGEVQGEDGSLLSDFNGVVYPSVFDKKVMITSFGHNMGSPKTFELQKNIVYRGKVRVHNGRFSYSFIVPKDIAYKYGMAKISYYAIDGVREAKGYTHDFVIGGYNPDAEADTRGPEIALYINDTTFINGGLTDENPVLLVKVFDNNGINTVGNGIGHDVTAVLDGGEDTPRILNDFYEASEGTYKQGLIHYPFTRLTPGEHTVLVKVWDSYNNSSEASITFRVKGGGDLVMERLRNYPNPFRYSTNFTFQHNQAGDPLDAEITIFDTYGQRVKVIEQKIISDGYNAVPIVWDGTAGDGRRVRSGIYFYRVDLRSERGSRTAKSGKLVIMDGPDI